MAHCCFYWSNVIERFPFLQTSTYECYQKYNKRHIVFSQPLAHLAVNYNKVYRLRGPVSTSGKEKAKEAAVAGVGAGVGSAAGGTVGVLELAAQGSVTALSAGVAIAAGAAVGAGLFLAGYGFYRQTGGCSS